MRSWYQSIWAWRSVSETEAPAGWFWIEQWVEFLKSWSIESSLTLPRFTVALVPLAPQVLVWPRIHLCTAHTATPPTSNISCQNLAAVSSMTQFRILLLLFSLFAYFACRLCCNENDICIFIKPTCSYFKHQEWNHRSLPCIIRLC